MKTDRSLLIPLLLLALCLGAYFLIFLPPTLVDSAGMSRFTSYDLHSFFLPKFVYGSRELVHGRLPLWNRYEFGGIPFLATAQPAVLYPPKAILFAVLNEETAYWIFLVLHYVLLAVGFLLFLREQGLSGLSAFAGTAAWTFSVPVLVSNYHPTRIANLAFVAPCFLLVERIGRGTNTRRTAAWLVVVLALQLTAGYPEFTVDLSLLVAAHAVARFYTKDWRIGPSKSIPLFAALFMLAALVAALQLVPMVEAAQVARRSDVAEITQRLLGTYRNDAPRELFFIAPGLCVFAIVGMSRRKALAPTAGLLVCTMLLFVGWGLLRHLPGLSMLRFPYVWFLYMVFYASWLVAIGVDEFLTQEAQGARPSRLATGVAVATLAWAAFCVFALFRSSDPPSTTLAARLFRNAGTALSSGLGAVGGLGLCALSFRVRGIAGRGIEHAVLLLLMLSHVAAFPYSAAPASVARPAPKGELFKFREAGVPINNRTLSIEDVTRGHTLTDGIPSLLGAEESFLPWRYRQILDRFSYSATDNTIDWEKLVQSEGFLQAANVKYMVVWPDQARLLYNAGYRAPRVTRQKRMLFVSTRPMTSAWIHYSPRVVPSGDWALDYVLAPDFDPFRDAIVEGALEQKYERAASDRVDLPVEENRVSDTEEEFVVDLPKPGLLIASESFYPGWQAFVDNQPAKILAADYVFRGVEVPPGPHRVRFEYRPSSVRWGLILSVCGLIALTSLFSRSKELT